MFVLLQHGSFVPSAAVAVDEPLAVIVNPTSYSGPLSADRLEAVFTMSQRDWSPGKPIIPFNYSPGFTMRDTFDRAVLGMAPDEVARYWIDRRIRGLGDSPRKVPSVALMRRVVAKLPGAIGYVPVSAVLPDVRVVAWVKDGHVVSPPPSAAGGAR
ncbi:MAG TPA: hypothetical protein VHM19_13560 [Polyangiales bacterium]|jgi:hypothetical protein|nr:hypothetical protein [Polyangiales bacterium]